MQSLAATLSLPLFPVRNSHQTWATSLFSGCGCRPPSQQDRVKRAQQGTAVSCSAVASVVGPSTWVLNLANASLPLVAGYLGLWTAIAVAFGPNNGWHMHDAIFGPLAALYAVLLVTSWEPSTLSLILPGSLQEGFSGGLKPQFLPQLSGIQQLFSRPITAASLMVHLASINLFAARSTLLEGGNFWWSKICTVLCVCLGPIGLLAASLRRPMQRATDTRIKHVRPDPLRPQA